MLSKKNQQLIKAYEKGYRIINGELFNPLNSKLNGWKDKNGYRIFHISKNGSPIHFHRLVAYQKFGDEIFKEGIEVRHLDNNNLNNFDDNIAIGTRFDNIMDISKKQRSINAGNQSRKYPHEKIIEFYNECKSYLQTMEKFGISSKGTLHYILNKGG